MVKPADYDDWTKDWTKNANLDPKNREKLIPLWPVSTPTSEYLPRTSAKESSVEGNSGSLASRRELKVRPCRLRPLSKDSLNQKMSGT